MIVIYPVNTTFPSPRANSIQILQTANALASAGATVHLIGKGSKNAGIADHYGIALHDNLTMHLVAPGKILNSARAYETRIFERAMRVIQRHWTKPKVVFTRDPLFAFMFSMMRRPFKFKLIYEAHTLFFVTAKETYMPIAWNERKAKRIEKRERFVFRAADAVVWISSSLQNFVRQYIHLSCPTAVVHDGTTVPGGMPHEKDPQSICYSGQFYWWKGVSTLIEAMRWVDSGVLTLYGGGYSTAHDDLALMQRVMDEHQLHSKVRIQGFLPPAQIASAISRSSIGVLPLPKNIIANHCNSPLKLFDYMANGLAVVASDLLTIREIINHGTNGHLVEPGNAKALADGLNLLLADSSYRESLAQNAFKTVKQYSWDARGRELFEFFNSVVQQ